jgi:hypothetical protein
MQNDNVAIVRTACEAYGRGDPERYSGWSTRSGVDVPHPSLKAREPRVVTVGSTWRARSPVGPSTRPARASIRVTSITMLIGFVYWAVMIWPQKGRAWNLKDSVLDHEG